MGIYILTVTIIISLGCLGNLSKNIRTGATVISCFLLGLIYAFRSLDCGDDTLTYSYTFDKLSGYDLGDVLMSYHEMFYNLLNWGISQLGGDYYDLMVIEAILLMGAILYFLLKNCDYPWIGLLLFIGFGCFHQSMNVSRQFIAIAFILCAMEFIEKKNPLKFSFFVCIAMMFHSSALIAFLIYPLRRLNIRGKEWILILTTVTVFALKNIIVRVFLLFLSSGYQIIDFQTEGLNLLFVWFLLLLILSFISVRYNNEDAQVALKLVFMSILFQTFVGQIPVVGRLAYYFIVPFYLMVPNVIKEFQNLSVRIFLITGLVGLILVFYIGFYLPGGASDTVPYLSQFSYS